MIWKKIIRPISFFAIAAAAVFTSVSAQAADMPDMLVPVGEAIGINIQAKGVIVSEISQLETDNGSVSPAKDAGIVPGDIITMINGQEISCAEDVKNILNSATGAVTINLTRQGNEQQISLTPYKDGDDSFIGLWLREAMSGIGTVTFFDPSTHRFGALGHSISDPVTGTAIPISKGEIMPAQITGVTKGKSGAPGQLGGVFSIDQACGHIDCNCQVGIFGVTFEDFDFDVGQPIPVASEDEIRTGEASILCSASGQVEKYDIQITRLYNDHGEGRSMMIKVTDDDLISITGGIVQGMSGSPIIQDGKLIGAVTHVLISDPEKGYGVSIQDMLSAAA